MKKTELRLMCMTCFLPVCASGVEYPQAYSTENCDWQEIAGRQEAVLGAGTGQPEIICLAGVGRGLVASLTCQATMGTVGQVRCHYDDAVCPLRFDGGVVENASTSPGRTLSDIHKHR